MLLHSVQVTKSYIESRFVAALFVSICLIGLAGCRPVHSPVSLSGMDEWREGDLVLRCGWGAESRLVVYQGHSPFSHIGILHFDSVSGQWNVIHAVPGEDEPEYVKEEPVERFFAPERAKIGAWLRVNCTDSVAKVATHYALRNVNEKILFDNEYLLEDSTQLYCTELVWRAFLTQGIDITSGRRHEVPTIFCKEGEAIFPNDIEMSEHTLFVKHFN